MRALGPGAAGLLILVLGCGRERGTVRPDVLLISIDTLRADHLGCYGYPLETSPNLDRFAREEAIVFEQSVSQAPATIPSHASLFTSVIPPRHGLFAQSGSRISKATPTIPEILARAGYATRSWNGGGQVRGGLGFGRGFERYESLRDERFADVVDRAVAWLREDPPDRPFFLFLHTYEVHAPYTPLLEHLDRFDQGYEGPLPIHLTPHLLGEITAHPEDYTDADRRHVVHTYDAEIHSMDAAFGRLVAFLRKTGRLDRMLVLFTSDHGEEFGEHGAVGLHARSLYEELVRVPLLLKLPGGRGAGRRVDAQVQGIDVMPTILAAAGVPPPPTAEGVDLAEVLEGRVDPDRPAVAQRWSRDRRLPISVRTRRWKLHDQKLFDLRDDPRETRDRAAEEPEELARLRAIQARARAAKPYPAESRTAIDPETREQLRQLGYVK